MRSTNFILMTVLFLSTLGLVFYSSNNYQPTNPHLTISDFSPRSRVLNTEIGPLLIRNNSEFSDLAGFYKWEGTGLFSSPYQIMGYNITADGGSGINISNTSVCL